MGFLTVIEVSKKQSYILNQQTKRNIGASEIIAFITQELPQGFVTNITVNISAPEEVAAFLL